jgi:hypothetical protein
MPRGEKKYKIDAYALRLWSSRPTTNLTPRVAVAGIHLYEGTRYRGHAYFYPDGTPLRSSSYDSTREMIFTYYNLSQFHAVLEIMRTEKPIYLFYRSPTYAGLRSGKEPTGEEEE